MLSRCSNVVLNSLRSSRLSDIIRPRTIQMQNCVLRIYGSKLDLRSSITVNMCDQEQNNFLDGRVLSARGGERGREAIYIDIYGERRIYMFFFSPKNIPTPPRKLVICKRNNASNGPCLRYTIDKYPEIPERKSCTLHGNKTKGNQTKERYRNTICQRYRIWQE